MICHETKPAAGFFVEFNRKADARGYFSHESRADELRHHGEGLSDENGMAICGPDLFAHGKRPLTEGSGLCDPMGRREVTGFKRSVRFDDAGVIGNDRPLLGNDEARCMKQAMLRRDG